MIPKQLIPGNIDVYEKRTQSTTFAVFVLHKFSNHPRYVSELQINMEPDQLSEKGNSFSGTRTVVPLSGP